MKNNTSKPARAAARHALMVANGTIAWKDLAASERKAQRRFARALGNPRPLTYAERHAHDTRHTIKAR